MQLVLASLSRHKLVASRLFLATSRTLGASRFANSMSLPNNCEIGGCIVKIPEADSHSLKRYDRKRLAASKVEYFQTPRKTLQDGGFIIYDDKFLDIIGVNPEIKVIAENDSYPFAHEAGVYIPSTGEVFITSNRISDGGKKKVQIAVVKPENGGKYSVTDIEPGIVMANGGVNYKDGVLFCEQGNLTTPGGLVWMSPSPPYATEMIVSNYHGRWFNSVNDVIIHSDGSIWFTDPNYGVEQHIRPQPVLPNTLYRYDPEDGDIRAMADGIGKPNGLCFSPDETTLYVTDTDAYHGEGIYEAHRAAAIYAFDVEYRHSSPFLVNKRLFATADSGIPDGIKCDTTGNVYSGCGDGVHVWTPGGRLIGKIYVPGGCANFCFGREGEVFLLNEHKMWRAHLDRGVKGDLLRI